MSTLQATVSTIDSWFKRQIGRLLQRRFLDRGLRGKMGTLVTVGMFGLMTVFGILSVSSARQATKQALDERFMLTKMSADTLDAMLVHIVDDMDTYAHLLISENTTLLLDNQISSDNLISIFHQPIYYLNESGDQINKSNIVNSDITWKEIPAVQSALKGEKTNLSAWPQYQPGSVVIATPVLDSSDRVIGALATLVNLSDLQILPDQTFLETNPTDVIDIVDDEGRIVFSNKDSRLLKNLTEELILTNLFSTKQGGVETCLGCPGTKPDELSDEVVAFAPLAHVPLGVVIRQPAEEVFSSVRGLVVWHTLLGLFSMAGAFGLVWLTTNNVIDPLKKLIDAAQRISLGDLDTPIEPLFESWPSNRPRRDEIGELGKSFDIMRIRLKDSIDEVQALNRDLDERVQERTTEAIIAQEEAQAAHDDLQSVIDALSDEMIVIDVKDRRIVQANRVCREKNKELGDTTQLRCFEMFQEGHHCNTPHFDCPLEEVVERGESVRVTNIRKKPGETQPDYLDIVASPLRNSQGEITRIVELVRDITEERRVRELLIRRNQQLAILNAIATTVSTSLDIREILESALEEVIHRTGYEVGAVFLRKDVLGQLDLISHFGFSEKAANYVSQFGITDGSCGGVLEHGQLVVIPDIAELPGQRAQALREEELTSLVHIPLTTKDYTLGSMCVGTRLKKSFGEDEENMLMAIGKQIAIAIENAHLYAELQQKELIRKELFRKAINAQEDERKRIARELHDETSQSLTALIFASEEGLEIEDISEIRSCLDRIHILSHQTLDGVHKLLYDLRPSMLDHLGLMPAIRWFAKSRLEPHRIRVSIKEDDNACRLEPEVEIALFRVVQEAITNITRHAGARNVHICCGLSSDQAQIEISDDGIGFEPTQITLTPDTGRGLGLLGMRERLEIVGGEFIINSMLGEGTQIHIRIPLNKNGKGADLA